MRNFKLFLIICIFLNCQANAQKVQSYSLPSEMPAKWREFGERIYMSVEKQAHYLLGTVHEWDKEKNLKLLTESKIGEHWIRPNTGAVVGFSFLYRFGNYDQDITGVPRDRLLSDYIIPMMRYLVRTHLTGDLNTSEGKKWGNAWQSAHWTYALAKGAWWIWNDLPADVQEGIRKAVKFEAARFYTLEPPYRLELNTASEENAWNSQIFQAALLLMPNDKDRPLWEELLKKWVISAYIRPSDIKSNRIIDGLRLSSFNGANIYNDFTLENHGIVHPDYMGSFILSGQFALDYAMRKKQVPEFIFFNNKGIYENLKWFALPDGGLNYPSGEDWPIYGQPDWLYVHILTATFLNDTDAPEFARRVLDCTEKMQKRNPAGNIYKVEENYFPSAHSDLILYGSLSWLTMFYMGSIPDKFTEKTGIKIFESGKIVINRTPTAIHSLSWGSKIMFQSVANKYDRVFDSDMKNGIGYIILKGQSEALPVTLGKDFKLENNKNHFTAEFSVNHGSEITAYYILKSFPDRMEVSEKLVANMNIETQTIASSFYGVLNNRDWIYETGRRKIHTDAGQDYIFISGQGNNKTLNVNEINIDGSVIFRSKNKMNARYESETKYYRSRITDRLILNYLSKDRTWTKGQVISQTDYEIKSLM